MVTVLSQSMSASFTHATVQHLDTVLLERSMNWNEVSIHTTPNSYPKSATSLHTAIAAMAGDPPSSIPFLVWLLENPASPVPFPGKIDLYRHDCLHVLLSRGFSLYDEAFVVGFTMGNDTRTKWWHLASFKLISTWLYPKKFRFNQQHLQVFDLGVAYGRTMNIRNLNRLDFTAFRDRSLNRLQCLIGIDSETLQVLRQAEATLTDSV